MRTLNNNYERILYCREAAAVERCHVVQKIGVYDIGRHSLNMLSMLRILWPTAPLKLVWAIVGHDFPERWTGDMPAPVKWQKPIIKTQLDEAEQLVYEAIGWEHPSLDDYEQKWLKGLDVVELYLWAHDQLNLGNSTMKKFLNRLEKYIISQGLPEPIMYIFDYAREKGIHTVGELD